ncbi:MAG: CHAT domain-containing protein [Nostoc sp. TH1S01]|nr:CHAT domain-containing protein [Nostoc sp. TH1S01]
MARKWSLFFSQLPTILRKGKYGFLALALTLFIVLNHELVLAAKPGVEIAQALTQQGFIQLYQGQADTALKTWQSAYQAYQKLNNQSGMTGSLINQSLAYQVNGSYINACQILTQALSLESGICPISLQQTNTSNKSFSDLKLALQKQPKQILQITGLYNLANVLRLMGEPETSYLILKHCLASISELPSDAQFQKQLLLNLANTNFSLYSQAKSKYQLTDESIARRQALNRAKSQFNSAQELYQNLSLQNEQNDEVSLEANLNWLKLILDYKSLAIAPTTKQSYQSVSSIINTTLTQLKQIQNVPVIHSIYYKLNFSQNLIKVYQDDALRNLVSQNLPSIALSLSQKALADAQKLNNQRVTSYAFGTLGRIYNSCGELSKAEHSFYYAMSLAQSVQAWDIAYEWQWELGKLSRLLGKTEQANQFYAAAIKNLDKIRSDIITVNSEIQFAFKDKVEPLYHEYIDLLLTKNSFNKVNAQKAADIQEQLNFAEVENFLRCGRFISSTLDSQPHHQLKDIPAIIYLIKLENRVEVLVKTPQNIYRHAVDFSLLDEPISNLFELISKPEFVYTQPSNFINYPQTVYHLLLDPIKQYLPPSGALGFVLDSYFQNLPLNMLYDGQKYFVSTYSISVSSSAEQLKQSFVESNRTLIGGVSQVGPSFNYSNVPKNLPPLPQVKVEIENIKKTNPSASILIDAEFTSQSFRQINEQYAFSVIHLSTHAQFSSDPDQTFVLAWDTPLNVKDLKFLLQNKNNQTNLDLLTLSACQTAKGDRRSFLGIAGIAAQAGARSILASLWLVDAESTSQLMSKFYEELKIGHTKAEALQLAQLSLLNSDKYSHPYYWSGFILVGG